MSQFIVANMAKGEASFEVHGVRCGDLRRKYSRDRACINGTWRVTGTTAEEVVAQEVEELQAQDQGYTADDFKVFPCCKNLS